MWELIHFPRSSVNLKPQDPAGCQVRSASSWLHPSHGWHIFQPTGLNKIVFEVSQHSFIDGGCYVEEGEPLARYSVVTLNTPTEVKPMLTGTSVQRENSSYGPRPSNWQWGYVSKYKQTLNMCSPPSTEPNQFRVKDMKYRKEGMWSGQTSEWNHSALWNLSHDRIR